MDILNVLHGGIALDSMPDYFMILNDALLDMITLSFNKRPESNQVVEKALNVLDSMKWSMLRANMWTREYDVSIEGRLDEIANLNSDFKSPLEESYPRKLRTTLKSWSANGSASDQNSPPRSQAKSSDYTIDIRRAEEKREEEKNPPVHPTDLSWIEDVFDPKGRVTPEDYSEWLESLQKHCLNKNPSNILKILMDLGSIEDQHVHALVYNGTFYTIWRDPPRDQEWFSFFFWNMFKSKINRW